MNHPLNPSSADFLPLSDLNAAPDAERADREEAAILEAFRRAGHRITGQRRTLLDVLRQQRRYLSAEALHRLAKQRGTSLSLATVYRTLALFKELRLVDGRNVGGDQEREEYRFRSVYERYTLSCKRCGREVPVEPDIVDAFREEVTATLGVTVIAAHSCFTGYCAECTAALAAEDDATSAPPAG
ncbi:MAG: transcriptional repressor [Chloroflexi bacterium]|nr:transcriptional repressor [Chloroflexota bacterium]